MRQGNDAYAAQQGMKVAMSTTTAPRETSRRFLALLAVPSFGLALAITTVTTYLPVLLSKVSGPTATGVLIGFEGLLALFVPGLVGGWSDRTRTRFGRRLPFVLVGAPAMAVALLIMPFTLAFIPLALLLFLFYAGYFTFYAPYRAMYPDLVPEPDRPRSQGSQNVAREAGLGVALVGGGFLLGVWKGLPFVVSAAVLLAVTGAFAWRVRAHAPECEGDDDDPCYPEGQATTRWRSWALLSEDADIRRLLTANALWELALGALKTFVVLFITVGLHRSSALASAALAIVAVGVVVAALAAGPLAERYGHGRLLTVSAAIYAAGLAVPIFVHSLLFLVALFPLAFAAGIVMTLPYSLLMNLLPDADHGAGAGAFEASRGLGVVLGPILAGVAVETLKPVFDSTQGYAAMFVVASVAVLISVPLARRATSRQPARRRWGAPPSAARCRRPDG
jgi:maltose/moltooligosaccharide transporter